MDSLNRVAIFIDNSNVLNTIKDLQKVGNFSYPSAYCPEHLAKKLAGNRTLAFIGFYCAPPPAYLIQGDEADKNRYSFTMKYYGLVSKIENIFIHYATVNGGKGNLQEKNLDTQMTTDIVKMAALNKYDTAIIVSNDHDFVGATTGAQELGKKVEIVYFKGFGSWQLRQKADVPRKAKPNFFKKIEGFDNKGYIPRTGNLLNS